MEYLFRLTQSHETFRVPELQAVATLVGVDLEMVSYNDFVCAFNNHHNMPFEHASARSFVVLI